MAIIVQDRFDGGLMGPRGMYRGSNEKQYAVKRLQNMEVRNEGSLHVRDRLRRSEFPTVSFGVENTLPGEQTREFDFSQVIWEGTKVLPFRFQGARYALHYTPYHYLTFVFDSVGTSTVGAFGARGRLNSSLLQRRGNFRQHASSAYAFRLEQAATFATSPLYNQIYLRDLGDGQGHTNFALIDWTRSTYLFNLYVVFREDGTVVRQGRPFHLRSIEPPNGERLSRGFSILGVGGSGLPHVGFSSSSRFLFPVGDGDGNFTDGLYEREAALQNGINWDLASRYRFPDSGGAWHPLLYEANFTPNVNYEFLDLGDTFTFVDTMGTVLPDVVHRGDIADLHGVYTPVTTYVAGGAHMPFPYDGRQEVVDPHERADFSIVRSGGYIETRAQASQGRHEGPLTTPSFNAEKGDPVTLDHSGFPGKPVPPDEFAPGRIYFLYGQTSHQTVDGAVVDRFLEGTHQMDLRFFSFRTGRQITGELFLAYTAPSLAAPPIIDAEVIGPAKNILRVSTSGESASTPRTLTAANRTTTTAMGVTETTPFKRIGLISRRASDVFVDSAPRMRLRSTSAAAYYPATLTGTDIHPFFHGPLLAGLKGFVQVTRRLSVQPMAPEIGFYALFDRNTEDAFLEDIHTAVLRTEEDGGVVFLRATGVVSGVNFPDNLGVEDNDKAVAFTETGGGVALTAADLQRSVGTQAAPKTFRLEMYSGAGSPEEPFGRPFWSGFHIDEYQELFVSVHFIATTAANRAVYFPGVSVNDRQFEEQGPEDLYHLSTDAFRRFGQVYTRTRVTTGTGNNVRNTLTPRLYSDFTFNDFPGSDNTPAHDDDNDEITFNFGGLVSSGQVSAVTETQVTAQPSLPAIVARTGQILPSISYRVPGITSAVTSSNRYHFPFTVVSSAYLRNRVGASPDPGQNPPRYADVDVRAYYSVELLRASGTVEDGEVSLLPGRIALKRPGSDDFPIPVYYGRDEQETAEPPVLDIGRSDFLPAIGEDVPLPGNWEYYAGRLFWFGRYSFGASEPFAPSNFNSYKTEGVENPPLDNLLGISGDDRVLWTEVYEGNLVIGLRDEMQQFRAGVSIVPSTIPTILARYPGTVVPPVIVRNFLFKASEDLRAIEMIAPRFQYAEKFVAEVVTDKVALDYFQDATIVRLTNHPDQHGFFVDLSDGRVLYAYVYREGTVAWSEMIYPGKGRELLRRSPLGPYYQTEAAPPLEQTSPTSVLFPQARRGGQELHFLSGTGDFLEDTLTCETELLPLSLLGRPMSARLNESAHQADTSVIVDMPLGEQLGIGKGEEIRTRISYSGGEIRTSYREGSEGDDGLLLRYTGSAPFRILRVARQDGPIQPGQIFPARETRHRKRLGRVEL